MSRDVQLQALINRLVHQLPELETHALVRLFEGHGVCRSNMTSLVLTSSEVSLSIDDTYSITGAPRQPRGPAR